jgi:hypothetical protein
MLGVKTARLERLVGQLEPFTYPIDGDCRLAPTGQPYVTLMSAGIKPEGATTDFSTTEKEAVDDFIEQIGDYIRRHSGTLYWRLRPRLRRCRYRYNYDYDIDRKEKRIKQYTVRCRLLCSCKPRWVGAFERKLKRGE